MFSYCAYQGCPNQNLPCSNITFFTLPRDERRQIWIQNSGNPEIQNLSEKTIKYFCEKHFDPKYIRRQFTRTTLHKTAVPYNYDQESYTLSYTNYNSNDADENGIIAVTDSRFVIADNYVSSNHSDEVPTSTGQYEIVIENIDESADETDDVNERFKISDVHEEKSGQISKRKKISHNYSKEEMKNRNNLKKTKYGTEDVENTSNVSLEVFLEANETEEDVCISEKKESETTPESKRILENTSSESEKNECVVIEDEMRIEERNTKILNEVKIGHSKSYSSLTNQDTLDAQNNKTSRKELTNSNSDYEEDKHFALSLVGYFQRLPHQEKALAKLKILQYLTELELNG